MPTEPNQLALKAAEEVRQKLFALSGYKEQPKFFKEDEVAQVIYCNQIKLHEQIDAAREALQEARKAIQLRGEQLDGLLAHCGKEGGECSGCAKIICPFGEELHFHHDGCPACCNAPKDNPVFLNRNKIDNITDTIDAVLKIIC
jgi:hypothetical protein